MSAAVFHVRSDGQRRRVLHVNALATINGIRYASIKVRSIEGRIQNVIAPMATLMIEGRGTVEETPIYDALAKGHDITPVQEPDGFDANPPEPPKRRRWHWKHTWQTTGEHIPSKPFTGRFEIRSCAICGTTSWKFHR